METLVKFIRDEEGASMAEYALLIGLITVAVATAITALRGSIVTAVSDAQTAIDGQN